MSVYLLEIDGTERTVLKDSLNLDLQANWQSTLACDIPSYDATFRPSVRSDVILKRDGSPIFGGILTQTPEEGLGGPNLDMIVTHVSAVGFSIYFTYQYVTATFAKGTTLKSALVVLATKLPVDITLDPAQPDGPTFTVDHVFTRKRLDEVHKELTGDTGWLPEIDPSKLYRMKDPASTPAPFDILDTGPVHQIGDLKVERTLDENYSNRVNVTVSGAGPATSSEQFTEADAVTSGGYKYFNAKYPASDAIGDMWPNELTFDGVNRGGIGRVVTSPKSWDVPTNAWDWDMTTQPARLRYRIASGAAYPSPGQVIDVAYAIGYPFYAQGNDTADQAINPIKESYVTVPEAMTLEAAQALADQLASSRSSQIVRAIYQTEDPGLLPGMTQAISVASRGIDEDECLITEVKLHSEDTRPGSEPIYEITALAGTVEQGNTRQVYKDWLETGGGVSGGVQSTGGVQPRERILFATVTLTDDQIKALPTTPIQVGPTPAANVRHKLVASAWRVQTPDGAYGNIDADSSLGLVCGGKRMSCAYENRSSVGSPPLTQLTALLSSGLDVVADIPIPTMTTLLGGRIYGEAVADLPSASDLVGAGIFISLDNNSAGDLTGGGAGNSLQVDSWYVEETFVVPATIPAGSLAFSGFGDSAMKFLTSDGAPLSPPASNPYIGTSVGSGGCQGIVALDDGTICITGAGYPSPNFECSLALTPDFGTIKGFDDQFCWSIASNYTDAFYGIRNNGASICKIFKFDNTGAKVNEWNIAGASLAFTSKALGVAPDESVAYLAANNGDTVIQWDLGGASESAFTTETGYSVKINGILVLRNGDVLVAWDKVAGGNGYVKHYDASGSLLYTYTLDGTDSSPLVLTPSGTSDAAFWVGYANSAVSTFSGVTWERIATVTGTVEKTFDPDDGSFEFDGPMCELRQAA